jgi:hypothetical protein
MNPVIMIQDNINEAIDLLVVLRDAVTNSEINPNTANYFVLINIIQNKLESISDLTQPLLKGDAKKAVMAKDQPK